MSELKITYDSLENAILKDGQLVFGKADYEADNIIISSSSGAFAGGYVYDSEIGAYSLGSFANGCASTNSKIVAYGAGSHAEGYANEGSICAQGTGAHAEGINTQALADGAHAEGYNTNAGVNKFCATDVSPQLGTYKSFSVVGDQSAVFHPNDIIKLKKGDEFISEELLITNITVTSDSMIWTLITTNGSEESIPTYPRPFPVIYKYIDGKYAHAEGCETIATGNYSHAGGIGTIANNDAMTAIGKYNVSTGNENTLFVVGCGNEATEKNLLQAKYIDDSRRPIVEEHKILSIGEFDIINTHFYAGAPGSRPNYTFTIQPKNNRSYINILSDDDIQINSSEGNILLQGAYINIDGDTEINGDINIFGDTHFDGEVYTNGNVLIGNNLNVSNDVSCNTLHVATGAYQTSDINLKDIISEDISLEKAYDVLEKCHTIQYILKGDESKKEQIGMIAQEIKEYFPEIISESKDGILSLDYTRLSVILFRLVKDLSKKNDDLNNRISIIEEKLKNL